jgi:hypothetical protein
MGRKPASIEAYSGRRGVDGFSGSSSWEPLMGLISCCCSIFFLCVLCTVEWGYGAVT